MTEPPTHIVDDADATTTRCGIKRKDPKALPFVAADFVEQYRKVIGGYCPECDDRKTD